MQDKLENITDTKEENRNYSLKELMILNAMKKVKNPFLNLTVADVAKDLKMGENLTNELFRRDDFPSINIGKTKTITLLAYLIWKMEKRQ